MTDRREELQELFESVTGTDAVTERQRHDRGTLSGGGDGRPGLLETIDELRSTLEVETDLSRPALATIVEGFYEGEADREIAQSVTAAHETVTARDVAEARLDLHLLRDEERPPEAATEALVAVEAGEATVDAAASAVDRPPATIRRWLAVRRCLAERRRVADRYRQAFEDHLADREIADRLTASLEDTGLEGAVADQEVDVEF
jgi:hypothetical protein